MAGENEEVKLLGVSASPFVMRTRFMLNIKKIPYEFVHADPFDKGELLLKCNPIYKKIPVLLHGDHIICESMIIVEYIDSIWKKKYRSSIFPSNPYDNATARFWATYIDDKLFSSMGSMVIAGTTKEKAEAVQQMLASLQVLDGAFEKCSKGKKFFGGDSIGFLDISLGGFVAIIRVAETMYGIKFFSEEKTPSLTKWVEHLSADEAVRSVMPSNDEIIEFLLAYRAYKMKDIKLTFLQQVKRLILEMVVGLLKGGVYI